MARIRVKAWIENCGNGMYRMRTNEGTHTDPTFNLASLQKQVDFINNEDADDPRYINVPDEEPTTDNYAIPYYERENQRYLERKKKEEERAESNRKSKRSNEKYVYVISCIERGCNTTEYFKGETNLLKMKSFTTLKVKDAKVFNTKASAQKIVDTITKVYLVKKVYRNFKVVQKKKELFNL